MRVQHWPLIPSPGFPEQPDLWNFLNFECLTLQEVTTAVWATVPKHASRSHFLTDRGALGTGLRGEALHLVCRTDGFPL